MRKAATIACVLATGLFVHCSEAQKERKETTPESSDLKAEVKSVIEQQYEQVYYPIPSPEQMFSFINDNGIDYTRELMNSTGQVAQYTAPGKKALNFGVYTADLAYAAAYQDINSTVSLYKVVKQLGADLDIDGMMSEKMMEQMQSNLQNPDSLVVIAGQSYYEAVDFLEQNGQEGKLALMSLGGWIESLYITLNAVNTFEEGSPTANRIADQKITFGNIYAYLKKNESEVGVSEALESIKEIRSVFASLKESRTGKITRNNESGRLVLGGGNTIGISKEQFERLKEAVNNYRAQITSINV
jgi:hypothetical protein